MKNATPAAIVTLYGNSATGSGWLAAVERGSKPFGEHEPKAGRGFTEAVWLALERLGAMGVSGKVRVFAPGGRRYADVPVDWTGYFGDMKWNVIPGV